MPRAKTSAPAPRLMALRDHISGEPSACAFSPDVLLRIAIGRATPVAPVGMINCIRTGEQAWSKHGWKRPSGPHLRGYALKRLITVPQPDGSSSRKNQG